MAVVNNWTGTGLEAGEAVNWITVMLRANPTTDVLRALGDTVPSSVAGYAKGCIFTKTNGGANTTLYVNEGTNTSCTFAAK